MSENAAALRIDVDASNPGQFFTCCGLLELADRLWKGAEGWFTDRVFCLAAVNTESQPADLLAELNSAALAPVDLDDEMATPLVLQGRFNLRLDWWKDDRAGGARYKTWAGQQKVVQIARAMKQPLGDWVGLPPGEWLRRPGGTGLPFNFDSDLGGQGAPLDVGFSLDPLGMGSRARPLIELAALVGLQRFRPASSPKENRHWYTTWPVPLSPEVAAVAAGGLLGVQAWPTYEFELLYRTKYLKSFLPAKPIGGAR
jgi:hypothetical protein